MKVQLFFLSIILYVNAFSQPLHNMANAITLGDKEGFPDYLYVDFKRAPSGKLFGVTYSGNIYINSNNSIKKIEALSNLPGVSGSFYFPDTATCFYFNSHRVAVIRNDSIFKIIPAPKEIYYFYLTASGRMFYFDNGKDSTTLYEFAKMKFKKLKVFKNFSITNKAQFVEDVYKNLWWFENSDGKLQLYKFNEVNYTLDFIKSYPAASPLIIIGFKNQNNFIAYQWSDGKIVKYKDETPFFTKYSITRGAPGSIFTNSNNYPSGFLVNTNGLIEILNLEANKDIPAVRFHTADPLNNIAYDTLTSTWMAYTNNKPIKIFPYLNKFPNLFGNNSSSVFSLSEDSLGRIWAASYKGGIALISKNQMAGIIDKKFNYLNGSAAYNSNTYLITENSATGLVKYDKSGNLTKLSKGTLGYFVFITKNKKQLFYGTTGYAGLWYAPLSTIEAGKPKWIKIDSSKGITLQNILTITEDSAGRIWCGHPKRGLAVYNPQTKKAQTWLIEKKQTVFGAYAAITDKRGTVWLGSSNKGLWYYNDYTKPATANNCKQVQHPLLNSEKPITALAVFKEWLVIAATDKIVLLNADSFYANKTIIVRYLNPSEAGFSAVTEQNTLLVSRVDSLVWFSTGDMLYQWDLKKWLLLKTFKVHPEVQLTTTALNILNTNNPAYFKPGTNSFDIKLLYHSYDLMPRYTRAGLIKKGDSLLLSTPGLQDSYSYKNIESGNYTFIVEIFETDGSTSTYKYKIVIKKYLWQQWWFLAVISLVIIATAFYFITISKKKQVAEQKAKTREAELVAYKMEQEKRLADLQLVSLSSQFRPHFILNALNTIGAQMYNMPEAETVLSRLGESINSMFNHTQHLKVLHHLESEWLLVTNIIDIHKLIYLKSLITVLPQKEAIVTLQQLQVPLGILQIPVENALLHGLSNKETGPWKLEISLKETDHFVLFTIIDNGVGRKKSVLMSNHTKHGTGVKNLNEILAILNKSNAQKIEVNYEDGVFKDAQEEHYGTIVNIKIPKNFLYE